MGGPNFSNYVINLAKSRIGPVIIVLNDLFEYLRFTILQRDKHIQHDNTSNFRGISLSIFDDVLAGVNKKLANSGIVWSLASRAAEG